MYNSLQMSFLPNNFFSTGYAHDEHALNSAAHKIAGLEGLIKGGRGLQLFPNLLPEPSLLDQESEGELGAKSRLIQGLFGGQSKNDHPGALAPATVSAFSPHLRVEHNASTEMARHIVERARAPAFPLMDKLSLAKTKPSKFQFSLLPESVRVMPYLEKKSSPEFWNIKSMEDLVNATSKGWVPPHNAS